MLHTTAALAAMLLAPLPAPAVSSLTVTVVDANGSGCPNATSDLRPQALDDRIRFYYANGHYLAGVGPAMQPTDFRKTCRLVLNIVPPAGYTYAVAETMHQGSAFLEPGATGTWRTVHHFDGDPAPEPVVHAFAGPIQDTWQIVETTPPEALVWAPCDNIRPLVISSRLAVSAGTSDPATGNSWLVMDGIEVDPNEFRLVFRPC